MSDITDANYRHDQHAKQIFSDRCEELSRQLAAERESKSEILKYLAQERTRALAAEREVADSERWEREILTDFKIPFDDHKYGRRYAITRWMAEQRTKEAIK